jgi:cytidine deaminase
MMTLFEMAKEYQTRAYAPYSNFRVGAAVLADDGKMYGGCNIETASFGGTICAERVAMTKAISQGATKMKQIAVIGDADYTYPCGICRQFMTEFSDDLIVHIIGPDDVRSYHLDELLPFAFTSEEMKHEL